MWQVILEWETEGDGGRGEGGRWTGIELEEKRGCNGMEGERKRGRGWMTWIEEENGINRGV